ncbi:enoyl-CoA hydratase/isomerase family protein [Streptomyces sp. NPDC001046]|uniref:enoyl-CoA hydratase/isomerase family protein n=1 Tax=Streptomyces sp. NPDC001046 TaxID=3364543 RepID=UPI00369726B0
MAAAGHAGAVRPVILDHEDIVAELLPVADQVAESGHEAGRARHEGEAFAAPEDLSGGGRQDGGHVRVHVPALDIRVLVLSSLVEDFCPGADRDEAALDTDATGAALRRVADKAHRLCQALENTHAITIARLHGGVIGAGLALAAYCDLRAGADTCRFRMPEVRLGLPPAWGGAMGRLIAEAGSARIRELMLTCDRFDALTTQRMGLLHRVAPLDRPDHVVGTWTRALLRRPPEALVLTKRMLTGYAHAQRTVDAGLLNSQCWPRSWPLPAAGTRPPGDRLRLRLRLRHGKARGDAGRRRGPPGPGGVASFRPGRRHRPGRVSGSPPGRRLAGAPEAPAVAHRPERRSGTPAAEEDAGTPGHGPLEPQWARTRPSFGPCRAPSNQGAGRPRRPAGGRRRPEGAGTAMNARHDPAVHDAVGPQARPCRTRRRRVPGRSRGEPCQDV